MIRFVLFLSMAVLLMACATAEYKGDIRYITDVPRHIVEREVRLLTDRLNSWARQVDSSDLQQGTRSEPYHNDQGMAIRIKITAGKRVLTLLKDKLAASGPTIDFTRKEWGRAADAHCRLDPDPGSSSR